jgi:hypothetical protein
VQGCLALGIERGQHIAKIDRILGVPVEVIFDLAPLRDSPHVNDKVKLTETEIRMLSPMRLLGVSNCPPPEEGQRRLHNAADILAPSIMPH